MTWTEHCPQMDVLYTEVQAASMGGVQWLLVTSPCRISFGQVIELARSFLV